MEPSIWNVLFRTGATSDYESGLDWPQVYDLFQDFGVDNQPFKPNLERV